jgi:hypothetical protein
MPRQQNCRLVEFVVETEPNHAGREVDASVQWHVRWGKAALGSHITDPVLQVDKEIFDPGGQVLGKSGLDTGAGRPAGFRTTLQAAATDTSRDVAERAAGSAIKQYPIGGIAEPGAQRRVPVALGLARIGAKLAGSLAVDPRPIKIALNAIDKRVSLEVDAQRRPNHEARGFEIADRSGRLIRIGPFAGAKALAQIEAEIDPAPVIGRDHRGHVSRRGARGGGGGAAGGGRSEASPWPPAANAKVPANSQRFMRPPKSGVTERVSPMPE